MRSPEELRQSLAEAIRHVRSGRATSRRTLADVMRLSPTTAGFYADHVVQLAPATCSSLEQMTRTSEPQKQSGAVLLDWSQGLVTVAHEAVHAAGVSSDAAAECFAIQWIPATAATFGMRRAVGVELAHAAWKVYPREPSNYRSSACHRGGRLDLNLHSTVWD